MESLPEYDALEATEQKEAKASTLINHLAAHAQSDAALLFTHGQYLLYYRRGAEVVCKGLAAESLRTAFIEEPVDSGWLPDGVIRCGSGLAGTFFVQFIPPGKRQLHLAVESSAEPSVITPPLPALLFAGVQTTYYVWALQSDHYDPVAPLFHAPFPNVYADGHICWGSNHPPEIARQTLEEAWHLFLSSPFNQDMAAGKSQEFSHDVCRQLHILAQTDASDYPVEDLVPYVVQPSPWSSRPAMHTLNDVVDYYLLKKGS